MYASDSAANLPSVLSSLATRMPERPAFIFLPDGESGEITLSLQALDTRARRFAAVLQARELTGERVLVCCPPGPEFVVALWACFYAGAVATPCYPPNFRLESRAMERLVWLCQAARPKLALTSADQLDKARWYSGNQRLNLPWLAEGAVEAASGDWRPTVIDPQATALLQYTSGSTAQPKGVMVSSANLLANIRLIGRRVGVGPADCCVSWLPPYHDMGLIGATLLPIVLGFPTVQMAPAHFLARPRRWLEAVTRFRATTSAAPNFAYSYCVERIPAAAQAGLDLSCWRAVLNGAEPVRARTLARFAAHFADCGFRPDSFVPCYGMAESTLMISASAGKTPQVLLAAADALAQGRLEAASEASATVELVSCGDSGGATTVAIVDPVSGQALTDGGIGEICLRGESVAQGYWEDAPGTAENFAGPGPAPGAWLRTGDLGAFVNGELYVTGRLKDLIIIRGRNYHPTDLEQYASACHPALADEAAVAIAVSTADGEALVLLHEVARDYRRTADQLDVGAIAQRIRGVLLERFEAPLTTMWLLRAGSLPRTTSGKLRRADAARMFAAGEFDTPRIHGVAAAQDDGERRPVTATQRRLSGHINAMLRQPDHPLPADLSLAQLGLDSLMRVELAVIVESQMDCPLSLEDFDGDTRLEELATRIDQYKAPPPSQWEVTGTQIPLLPLQRQFLRPGITDPQQHVTVAYLRTPADCTEADIHSAVAALAWQFDALRLRFSRHGDDWTQRYAPPAGAIGWSRLATVDLDAAQRKDLQKLLWDRLYARFDLENDPPAAAIWLDTGAGQTGILAIRLHHLITDGLSQVALLNALERNLREVRKMGVCPIAPAQGASFGQWSRVLHRLAGGAAIQAERDFWATTCQGAPHPSLAFAGPAEADDGPAFFACAHPALDAVATRRFIRAFPDTASQYAAIVAAAAAAWCGQSGQADLLLMLENHGRHAVLGLPATAAVGWMVCHHPLRLRGLSARCNVAGVTTAMDAVPNGGLGYGLLRHCQPGWPELPVPRIAISHRGQMDEYWRGQRQLKVLGLGHASRALSSHPEHPDWRMLSWISQGSLQLVLDYRRQRCDQALATRWCEGTAQRIRGLLDQSAAP